jgi:Flp pilus assembly protein CpaB
MATTAPQRNPLGNGARGAGSHDGRAQVAHAPRAASVRRGLLGRVSAGHLVMVVAGLLGVVLTVALLRAADDRQRVAVAAREVPVGSTLTAADVRYARVKMDEALLDTVLRPADLESLGGSIATDRIAEGDLIPRSALRPAAAPSGQRAMSIPIDPARAVNGELETGDRVDVVVATASEVAIIVAGAEVLDVHGGGSGGAFGGVGDQFAVTLAVDARESQLLTAAVTDGDVMITRTTGARSAGGTPPLPIDRTGGAR